MFIREPNIPSIQIYDALGLFFEDGGYVSASPIEKGSFPRHDRFEEEIPYARSQKAKEIHSVISKLPKS